MPDRLYWSKFQDPRQNLQFLKRKGTGVFLTLSVGHHSQGQTFGNVFVSDTIAFHIGSNTRSDNHKADHRDRHVDGDAL